MIEVVATAVFGGVAAASVGALKLVDKHLDSRYRRLELETLMRAEFREGDEVSVYYSDPHGTSVQIVRRNSPDSGSQPTAG